MDSNGAPKNRKQRKRRKTNHNPETTPMQMVNPTNQPVNIAIQQENPLLNPFILETVLIFCKDNPSFSSLRLVSKLWDIEVCKIIRPQTQIPLPRILTAYPEGLGWKWNRSHKSIGYHYQSPYPDTPEFPNIKVTVSACKVIKDPKVIRWFKVMGSQVKSLHYSSALNCYHQNIFLGNCLQTWCPNLETLHLSGVQCFASLIHIFEGERQQDRIFKGLNCTKLTSLIISVDSDDPRGYLTQCRYKKSYFLLSGRRNDISVVTRGTENFTRLIGNLPERDPESGEHFYQLIEKKTEDLPKNYFEEVIIPKYFISSDYCQYWSVDWGIIGLILRAAPLRKIIIKKLNGKQQCRDLTLFLLYQPSKLRGSLEHLEFQDNVFVGRDPTCLKNLSLLKCPLKCLRLDNFVPFKSSMGYLNDLLENCKGTLETLEMGTAEYTLRPGSVPPIFNVPKLPNLKTFVHRNLSRFPLEGTCLLRNCPKLETCKFLDEGINLHQQRDDFKRRAVDLFCDKLEECGELGHNLRELEIGGKFLMFENVVKVGTGLGNLRKMDVEVDGAKELEFLLEWMVVRWRKMEELRVLVGGMGDDGEERWNEMFTKHLSKIKSLKFLEMGFQKKGISLSMEALRNGFGKMEGLTSLKIDNFGVVAKDKMEIARSLGHIPFVILTEMRIHSQPRWINTAINAVLSLLNW